MKLFGSEYGVVGFVYVSLIVVGECMFLLYVVQVVKFGIGFQLSLIVGLKCENIWLLLSSGCMLFLLLICVFDQLQWFDSVSVQCGVSDSVLFRYILMFVLCVFVLVCGMKLLMLIVVCVLVNDVFCDDVMQFEFVILVEMFVISWFVILFSLLSSVSCMLLLQLLVMIVDCVLLFCIVLIVLFLFIDLQFVLLLLFVLVLCRCWQYVLLFSLMCLLKNCLFDSVRQLVLLWFWFGYVYVCFWLLRNECGIVWVLVSVLFVLFVVIDSVVFVLVQCSLLNVCCIWFVLWLVQLLLFVMFVVVQQLRFELIVLFCLMLVVLWFYELFDIFVLLFGFDLLFFVVIVSVLLSVLSLYIGLEFGISCMWLIVCMGRMFQFMMLLNGLFMCMLLMNIDIFCGVLSSGDVVKL